MQDLTVAVATEGLANLPRKDSKIFYNKKLIV